MMSESGVAIASSSSSVNVLLPFLHCLGYDSMTGFPAATHSSKSDTVSGIIAPSISSVLHPAIRTKMRTMMNAIIVFMSISIQHIL